MGVVPVIGTEQKHIDSLNKLRMAHGGDGKAALENNLLQVLLPATIQGIYTDDIASHFHASVSEDKRKSIT